MSKDRRVYDDDDGRTIADMNIEGMPWYERSRRREKRGGTAVNGSGPELRGRDRGAAFLGILAAIAAVTVIFAVVFLLVILLFTALGK